MSDQVMRGLLQTRLMSLGWANQTVFEKRSFTPTPGFPYQEVTTVFLEPEAITVSGSDLGRGVFQVRLMYPLQPADGIGEAWARAEQIRTLFPRNLRILGGGATVKITRKPVITRGPPQGDRDVTIVHVRFADR